MRRLRRWLILILALAVFWTAASSPFLGQAHPVDAGSKRLQLKMEQPAVENCQPVRMHLTTSNVDQSFNILNSLLGGCDSTNRDLVEPSWFTTRWFDIEEVYCDLLQVEEAEKHTIVQPEQLVQNSKSGRAGCSEEQPPGGPARDIANSSVLFSGRARDLLQRMLRTKDHLGSRNSLIDPVNPPVVVKLLFDTFTPAKPGWCNSLSCAVSLYPSASVPDRNQTGKTYATQIFNSARVLFDPTKTCGSSGPGKIEVNCFYYIVDRGNGVYRTRAQTIRGKLRFSPNDVVYLLKGFHVMVGDIPEWTWATYFWTLAAHAHSACPAAASGSLACRSPWNNYAMDGFRDQVGVNPGRRYNPYIEGETARSVTNCLYCHARARYRDPALQPNYISADQREGQCPSDVLLPCGDSTHQQPCGSGATPTHFLWTLAGELAKRQAATASPPKSN